MESINLKEKQEFIIFELIQDSLGLNDPILFKNYLTEIYNDIVNLINDQNVKLMTILAFNDYLKISMYITGKIYNSFSNKSPYGLTKEEFVDNMFKIYKGSFEETIKVIFNILDFDKEGIIKKDEVKLFLRHLPISGELEEEEKAEEKRLKGKNENGEDITDRILKIQMKSLEEIDKIIDSSFNKFGDKMNLEQFTEITIKQNSEIFLRILFFLCYRMPFSSQNVEEMRAKYNKTNEIDFQKITVNRPRRNSLILPTGIFSRKFNIRKYSLKENEESFGDLTLKDKENKKDNKDKPKISNNNFLMRKESKSLSPENKNTNKNCIEVNNKHMKESEKKKLTKNSKDLQEKNKINNYLKTNVKKDNNPLTKLSTININEPVKSKIKKEKIKDYIANNKDIRYENWVYKRTKTGKLRKFYLVLINRDIYYYKSEMKTDFVGMHNLTGYYFLDTEERNTIEGKEYFAFKIYNKNKYKERKFFTDDAFIYKQFVYIIKKSTCYFKFSDLYELYKEIGKGSFGVVYLGQHKKTKQLVAIKILKKEKIDYLEEFEIIRTEIDILKLCHHPNILRILDNFEDNDYIYIVTEYIEGGTLRTYLKEKKDNLTEKKAAEFMFQIASGIKYLHQFGIVHRDLKPANISLKKQKDLYIIKIMDFGISQIMAPNQITNSSSGTLVFEAPETVQKAPQNKEVDIWAMGVMLYYMMNGSYPFSGEDKEIKKNIVNQEVIIPRSNFLGRSEKVKDLIKLCLKKDRKERINIDEFMNHPWFKENGF